MSGECKCNMSYHGVPFHWDDCPESHRKKDQAKCKCGPPYKGILWTRSDCPRHGERFENALACAEHYAELTDGTRLAGITMPRREPVIPDDAKMN